MRFDLGAPMEERQRASGRLMTALEREAKERIQALRIGILVWRSVKNDLGA